MKHLSLSIKSKVTLTVLLLFIVSIWGAVFYIDSLLKKSVQSEIANFQISSLNALKYSVEKDISFSLQTVTHLARYLPSELLNDIPELQRYLDERMNIQEGLFDTGIHICSRDGMTLVETPRTGAVGINYGDRKYFKTVLATGKPYISEPVIGKLIKKPFMTVTAPIFDKDENITGVVIGIIGLMKGAFLTQIAQNDFGEKGEVYLFSLRDGLFIKGYQNTLSLQKIAGSKEERLFKKYIEGLEGSSIEQDGSGEAMLISGVKMLDGDWLIGASLPAKEAFSLIRMLERNILYAVTFATLLTLLLVWYLLHTLLKPLLLTANQIKAMSASGMELATIKGHTRDEIGVLIESFNVLQRKRKKLEESLIAQNEELHKSKEQLLMFERARRISIMELLHNIAHQWRQPLNVVGIRLSNIEDSLEISDKQNQQEINSIKSEIEELSNVITKFSSFYHKYQDTGRADLKNIIHDSLSLFDFKSLYDYTIESAIDEDIFIEANESIFAEILSAMINNSLEIGENREIKDIRIKITACKRDGNAEIRLSDNCGGIESELRTILFDPYTTTHFKHRGKGLGLFMVKKAVEDDLKGEITVDNIEEGAEFLIKIPLADDLST